MVFTHIFTGSSTKFVHTNENATQWFVARSDRPGYTQRCHRQLLRSFAPVLLGKARCVRTRQLRYILNLHPEIEHTSISWVAKAKTDASAARILPALP